MRDEYKTGRLSVEMLAVLDFKLRYDVPLTSEEAGALTGDDEATLARKRVSGTSPPYIRIGRRVRYVPSLLLSWMRDRPNYHSTAEQTAPLVIAAPAQLPSRRRAEQG